MKVRGSLFRLYLASYAGFRFLIEFVRGDTAFPIDGFIKPVQWLLLTASIYFGWVYYRNEIKMTIKAN
jgi:prolipoprotein diacylglyceryltransferase